MTTDTTIWLTQTPDERRKTLKMLGGDQTSHEVCYRQRVARHLPGEQDRCDTRFA